MHRFAVWQLVDSAFPSGAFAHSWGLEAAWQSGEVPDQEALQLFLREAITQAGHGVLPLASSAHEDPSSLARLDALCHAFLTNVVASRASCVQGRAFLATCARVWPDSSVPALEARAASLHGHYAPIFGAVLRRLETPLDLTQQLCLYATARGVLSAAVRLGIAGSYAAQRLLHESTAHLEAVFTRCAPLREPHLAQTAPVLDLLQAAHDRLYSRLFQS
jgi:urease accessory protein